MILYYVRHGDPIYDPDSLTELGKKQAEALAPRFARLGLNEIYSSTSIRAIKTAEPTAKALGLKVTLLPWAHENLAFDDFSVKEGEGRNWSFFNKEFKQKALAPAVRAMGENWHLHPHFQTENFTRGVNRVNAQVDEFFLNQGYVHDREKANFRALKKNEKRIAFFAHEGFAKAFFSSLLDIPYPVIALKTDMGHSGVTVVYFDEREEEFFPRVMQWSDSSHLSKADLITPFQNWLEI